MPSKPGRPANRGARRPGFSLETGLQRRVGTRKYRRIVLIVTNGEATEKDYFEALKQEPWVTAAKVIVKFERGEPDYIVGRAGKIRDDECYAEAWVVCDKDEFDVTATGRRAAELGVELALSVPCFEVWLILHLSQGCPRFNTASQAGDHLKKQAPLWDKARLNFADFRDGVWDAVDRAQRLGEPPDANPSTSVWRLIESLRYAPQADSVTK